MRGPRRNYRLAAAGVAAAALVAAAVLGATHGALLIHAPDASGSIEWDFYYSYARDAKRIAFGLAPLDEYRGPLYPLLLALAGRLLPVLSAFTLAKGVAALSTAGAVSAVYLIAEEVVEPAWAVAVAAATAVTAPFLLHGFLVGTDMFFACLCLFAIYAVMRALGGSSKAAIVAGLLSGLAMSTRWNAAFLPAAALASFVLAIDRPVRERARLATAFAIAFAVTLAPWLALNASLHGSPFFNRNYVNASLGIYDGGVSFDSLGQAVAYAPRYFAKRWATNVVVYAWRVGEVVLPFAVVAVGGLVLLAVRGRRRPVLWALPLFAAALFVVNAIGPYVVRQYLVAIPLVLTAAAAVVGWIGARERTPSYLRAALGVAWAACVVWFLMAPGIAAVRLAREAEARQLAARRMVGTKPATPMLGDWDGDGRDEIAVARDGEGYKVFYLFRGYTSGPADWIAAFGPEGATPLAGRWTKGAAADTIGVFNKGGFFLKNQIFSGAADLTVTFGDAEGAPLTGDWNGDGRDTLGTFRDGTFSLTDQMAGPFLVRTFSFGTAGDRAVAGDWDGDGVDTVGLFRDGVFTLTNRTAPPFDDAWQVRTDLPGTIPLAGDWDGDGRDAPALYAGDGTFYFLDADGPKQWKIDPEALADLPVAGE